MADAIGALGLSLLSAFCWGTWSNTAKAAKNVPFPLFYLDYSIGVVLVSALAFLSVGERQFFTDAIDGWEMRVVAALCAGCLFNVGNVLLVIGIALAGLAVAFPVGIGLALVLGTMITFAVDNQGDPLYLFAGVAAALAAILVQVAAKAQHQRDLALAHTSGERSLFTGDGGGGGKGGGGHDGVSSNPGRSGIWVCMAAGGLIACFPPLSAYAMKTHTDGSCNGCLTPFGLTYLFSVSVFLSSFVLCKALMLRPVTGDRTDFRSFAQLSWSDHGWGVLGGALWALGTVANLMSGSQLGVALSYAIGQSAPMVATAWGVFYYKEFEGARSKTKALIASCFALFLLAISLVAMSKE